MKSKFINEFSEDLCNGLFDKSLVFTTTLGLSVNKIKKSKD